MENLTMVETEFTPGVMFDCGTGALKVTGRSLPEDARDFYYPILQWIKTLENHPVDSVEFTMHLNYFNSSSAKQLIKIFYVLEELQAAGKSVNIRWLHDEQDSMLRNRGKELSTLIEIPFEVVVG